MHFSDFVSEFLWKVPNLRSVAQTGADIGVIIVMKSGVPQGSPYSPIVFVVYLAYNCDDFSSVCQVMVFCDDLSILVRSPTPDGLMKTTQKILNHFQEWLKTRDLECEPSKSKFCMFFRTKSTVQKYWDLLPSLPKTQFVKNIRVLGVMVDFMLNFATHVNKVCNRMRVRINLLRMMKECGLGRENALKYAVCVRSCFHFGLYWTTMISDNLWNKIERVWNQLLRTAIHEKCPSSTNISVIRLISGYGDIRTFCDYLIHLRTVKLQNSTRFERFTLNVAEMLQLNNFTTNNDTQTYVKVRNATSQSLSQTRWELAFEEKRRKMGSIKSYTYQLTKSQKWTPNDFERTKTELRKKYKVRKVKTMQAIEKMSKSEMLGYLDYFSHSYRKIAPKKSKETRKSVCTE